MAVSSMSVARHRSTGRPATPLSDLAATATGSLAVVGRRSVVAVASSGLVVSMLGAPAAAAPSAESATGLPAVDTSTLTASARAVLATEPVVTVPVGATWSFDLPALTVVADPPSPPVRAVTRAASRSQARASAPEAAAAGTASAGAQTTGAPAPASANGSAIIEIASRYVGVPYLYGGTTPNGFDCSGFTSYVFAQLGISLPRTSTAQRDAGTVVSRADAAPGDLIWHPGHVGIYAGGDTMVDSPQAGGTVQFREIYFSNPVFIRLG